MTGDAKNQPGRNKLSPGIGEAKFSLGLHNCSYSNSNFALCTNLFDGRRRTRIENTKTATWLLPCSPNKLTAAQRRVFSDSKAFE